MVSQYVHGQPRERPVSFHTQKWSQACTAVTLQCMTFTLFPTTPLEDILISRKEGELGDAGRCCNSVYYRETTNRIAQFLDCPGFENNSQYPLFRTLGTGNKQEQGIPGWTDASFLCPRSNTDPPGKPVSTRVGCKH